MPKGVHHHQRRRSRAVPEVVLPCSGREGRTRGRLGRDRPQLLPTAVQLVLQEREGQAGEITSATMTRDDEVRVFTRNLHLLLCFLSDDRLVQEHVVEHAAERVLRVVAFRGVFDGFGDRDAEAARRVGRFRQNPPPGLRQLRGARHDVGAVGLHHDAPVRLLVVADLHHVHHALEPHETARARQRAAPLTGPRFGRESLHPLLFVDVRLDERGIQLVAADRADMFRLVVNVRRRVEHGLECFCSEHRCGTVQAIEVPHLVGNLNIRILRHLLRNQPHREDGRQHLGTDGFARARVQRRLKRRRQVRDDVVEVRGNLGFRQHDLRVGHRRSSPAVSKRYSLRSSVSTRPLRAYHPKMGRLLHYYHRTAFPSSATH